MKMRNAFRFPLSGSRFWLEHRKPNTSSEKALRAFSLVELLVVISIFSLISVLVLGNHSRYNTSVLLESLAYDVALSVRQAQVYGISVRQASTPGQFQIGYGVHFASATPTTYIFFVDLNKNGAYDGASENVEVYTIGRGHVVERFCAETTLATTCSDSPVNPLTFLDITFLRPNPDATFTTNSTGTVYSRGTITMSSGSGEARIVVISSTGAIAVGQAIPPP